MALRLQGRSRGTLPQVIMVTRHEARKFYAAMTATNALFRERRRRRSGGDGCVALPRGWFRRRCAERPPNKSEKENEREMREIEEERRGARNMFDRPAQESERGRRARSHCDRRVQLVGRCRCQPLHRVVPHCGIPTVPWHTRSRCATTIVPFLLPPFSIFILTGRILFFPLAVVRYRSRWSRSRVAIDRDPCPSSSISTSPYVLPPSRRRRETHVHAAERRTRDDVRRRSATRCSTKVMLTCLPLPVRPALSFWHLPYHAYKLMHHCGFTSGRPGYRTATRCMMNPASWYPVSAADRLKVVCVGGAFDVIPLRSALTVRRRAWSRGRDSVTDTSACRWHRFRAASGTSRSFSCWRSFLLLRVSRGIRARMKFASSIAIVNRVVRRSSQPSIIVWRCRFLHWKIITMHDDYP